MKTLPMKSALACISVASVLLGACAAPAASTEPTYQAAETVTGSRIPRKSAPQGTMVIDGDDIRSQQGQLAPPNAPMARPRGSGL